jgi:DNA-binding NarL/FixJ family response regulator
MSGQIHSTVPGRRIISTNVMVIFNHRPKAELFKQLLRNQSLYPEVRSYSSYFDAIKNLRRDRPDLIICDPFEDERTGFGFIELVKRLWPLIHIIACNDSANPSVISRVFENGVHAYICFGEDPQRIEKIIENIYYE